MTHSNLDGRPRRADRGFYRGWLRGALVGSLVLLVTACVTTPVTGRRSFNALSIEQDKELGAQAYADVLKTSKLRDHGPEFEMVKRVVTNLTRVADDPGFDWEVHPAYRWALQPDDLTSIFDHLVLTAD